MRSRRRQLHRVQRKARERLERLQADLSGCSPAYRARYIQDVLWGDRPYPARLNHGQTTHGFELPQGLKRVIPRA